MDIAEETKRVNISICAIHHSAIIVTSHLVPRIVVVVILRKSKIIAIGVIGVAIIVVIVSESFIISRIRWILVVLITVIRWS